MGKEKSLYRVEVYDYDSSTRYLIVGPTMSEDEFKLLFGSHAEEAVRRLVLQKRYCSWEAVVGMIVTILCEGVFYPPEVPGIEVGSGAHPCFREIKEGTVESWLQGQVGFEANQEARQFHITFSPEDADN